MTDEEQKAMRLALEALEHVDRFDLNRRFCFDEEIDALHAALAQPEQEPYADKANQLNSDRMQIDPMTGDVSIGTPSKPWVSLTFEEIKNIWVANYHDTDATDAFAYAIEAKLKEKNT